MSASNKVPDIAVRGVRQSMPTGYVIGRVSDGVGPPELIPISTLSFKQIASGLVQQAGASSKFVCWLGFALAGGGTAVLGSQVGYGAVAPVTATFPTTTAAEITAVCDVAPLANYVLYVINNITEYENAGAKGSPNGIIATITFAANSTTGTISWAAGSVSVPLGTYLYFLTSPTSKDATIQGINILLAGDYVSG